VAQAQHLRIGLLKLPKGSAVGGCIEVLGVGPQASPPPLNRIADEGHSFSLPEEGHMAWGMSWREEEGQQLDGHFIHPNVGDPRDGVQ
jgi:hypothetical protein